MVHQIKQINLGEIINFKKCTPASDECSIKVATKNPGLPIAMRRERIIISIA